MECMNCIQIPSIECSNRCNHQNHNHNSTLCFPHRHRYSQRETVAQILVASVSVMTSILLAHLQTGGGISRPIKSATPSTKCKKKQRETAIHARGTWFPPISTLCDGTKHL